MSRIMDRFQLFDRLPINDIEAKLRRTFPCDKKAKNCSDCSLSKWYDIGDDRARLCYILRAAEDAFIDAKEEVPVADIMEYVKGLHECKDCNECNLNKQIKVGENYYKLCDVLVLVK